MADIEKILEERGASYGAFNSHAEITQDLKRVFRDRMDKNRRFRDLNPLDRDTVMEALDMIAHKLGRILNGDPLHEDSWDDIAGYAKLVNAHTTGAPF